MMVQYLKVLVKDWFEGPENYNFGKFLEENHRFPSMKKGGAKLFNLEGWGELAIMNSEGKNLNDSCVRSEDKKSTELSVNTEAIDSVLFWLEQLKM